MFPLAGGYNHWWKAILLNVDWIPCRLYTQSIRQISATSSRALDVDLHLHEVFTSTCWEGNDFHGTKYFSCLLAEDKRP